jgi:hypothetical protein
MRTVIVLALLSVFAVSLVGCGDSGTGMQSTVPGERPLGNSTPGTSPASAPAK